MDFITFMTMIFAGVKKEELVQAALIAIPVYLATKSLVMKVMNKASSKIDEIQQSFEKHAKDIQDKMGSMTNEIHGLNTKVGDVILGFDMAKKSYDDRFQKIEFKNLELTEEVIRLRSKVESLDEPTPNKED